MKKIATLLAAVTVGTGAFADTSFAQSGTGTPRTVKYNCMNGPQLVVTYYTKGPDIVDLKYAYHGPASAMRFARKSIMNKRLFKDGANRLLLTGTGVKSVRYSEAKFFDKCTATSL
jgi:hypothetical protein